MGGDAVEFHEFLAYLFDHQQTRDLAHTLAAAVHSRAAAAMQVQTSERVLVDA
jgi:hypothetical protein